MKKIIFLVFVCLIFQLNAQKLINSWQYGIGGSVVMFSEADAGFIGDDNLLQYFRANLTKPINDTFALDASFSFNTKGDLSITDNKVKFMSIDLSLRYYLNAEAEKFRYYILGGSSMNQTTRNFSGTANLGLGATYWFSSKLGINLQGFYKYSPEQLLSMRSHTQYTFALVFRFGKNYRNTKNRLSNNCF